MKLDSIGMLNKTKISYAFYTKNCFKEVNINF